MAERHELWDVLAVTRPATWDPDGWADRLVEHLTAAGLPDTLAFGEAFDRAMAALYRWDLWGACYLAFGGLSDDGFEYVRVWLVAQGEDTWRRAQTDPEGLLLDLLGGLEDPDEVWEELGLHEAEPVLYAAGTAHERLTGRWRPPTEGAAPEDPAGTAWEEDELVDRFPRLAAALPEGWDEGGPERAPGDGPPLVVVGPGQPADDELLGLLDEYVAGLEAFAAGDHVAAAARLGPLVDDPVALGRLREAIVDVSDICYGAGMSRLLLGDADGAARALRAALDGPEVPAHVRRGLAQIELARGALDDAARLLDASPDADLMDRALVVTLLSRQGHGPAAEALTQQLLGTTAAEAGHPWDLAGALAQCGLAAVELGDGAVAQRVADAIAPLIAGAPDELPLHAHLRLVRAGALRLAGRVADAEAELGDLTASSSPADRAAALLEAARQLEAAGGDAAEAYRSAAEALASVGERWQAEVAQRAAGSVG